MTDPFTLVVALIVAILTGWMIRLEVRIHRLMTGSDAKNLEGVIGGHGGKISSLEEAHRAHLKVMEDIERRLKKSIQTVRTIRFDPFEGTAGSGKQSFATAFLDEKGDGVVVSSLYTRDKVSVFAKPIEHMKSQYELTKEEKEALSGIANT